jgi:DNA-binding NarL/FixJ family response regulator
LLDHRITVLAVDDHPLLREGIASVLDGEQDIQLIAQASSGREAIELHRQHRPDVTLMDIQMPGMSGIETMREIRREFSQARIIMLTIFGGRDTQARSAIDAGASGYLLKRQVNGELRAAIRSVNAGHRYVPDEVASELTIGPSREMLTTVEIDVLRLAAAGFSNKRVAIALDVPEETVKSRMKSILAKLGANDRTQAVTMALKRGTLTMF